MINLNYKNKQRIMNKENSFELDDDLIKDIEAMVDEEDKEEETKGLDSGINLFFIFYFFEYFIYL
jgi:hypothetical protein